MAVWDTGGSCFPRDRGGMCSQGLAHSCLHPEGSTPKLEGMCMPFL